ncbi:Tetratricopeptide repeat-domain-containing protein [Phaeosphaeriaceae sp. PMI808]|nr:Tetratricopeptide repeat-domain-containing protein [Phaeosphaeriaceae sp. PMI808]
MDKTDALALLRNKLGQQDSTKDITTLADALEYIPLAMVQAAAYVTHRPRCSVEKYVIDFQESERQGIALLCHEGGDFRRDLEASSSIIITSQISFNYIRQTRPSAADLLSLMSFYDHRGIPKGLLQVGAEENISKQGQGKRTSDDDGWGNDEDDDWQSSARVEFEFDVLMLFNYSFISFSRDGDTVFEMYRLVQLATRNWLEINGQYEQWQQLFLKNLCAAFPMGEYENWPACQILFPHAKSAAAQRPERHDLLRDWASILYKAAWYAWQVGNASEAETMSFQAMRARESTLGEDDEDTLNSMELVALVLQDQGKYEEAETMSWRALEGRGMVLGKDHPDTLSSVSTLASVLQDQGKYEEAETMSWRALEGREEVLGEDHPDTLTSVHSLASLFDQQRRYDTALPLYERASSGFRRQLGPEHPTTIAYTQDYTTIQNKCRLQSRPL